MPHRLSALTLNQRLALLAFVLGAVALAAQPTRGRTVSIHPAELALIVQREADQVTTAVLADRLVKGQADFRLIDVREEPAYAAYHIPGAENVPIAALPASELPPDEQVVLYADDGVRAAQAWFLLRARGHKGAYMLRGGLAEWRDQVLSPVLPVAETAAQRQENEKRAALAAYFGGAPRTASGAPSAAISAPVATAIVPPPSAVPVPSAPAKAKAKAKPIVKRKEGC